MSTVATGATVREAAAPIAGEVAGWARALRSAERCAFAGVGEYTIYLDRAARGRGVGKQLLERPAGGRHRALSAGSEADPGGRVHPQVVEVMRDLGMDLSGRRPQRLTHELAEQADVVVTMG